MQIERRTIESREQWLEWRRDDITASVIGALFGEHTYTTALRLYVEKRGVEFPKPDDSVLRRGRWLESAVRVAVSEKFPQWNIIPANVYLRAPQLRLGATPDFFIEGDPRGLGVLQAKTVAPSVFIREWNGGTECPFWITLQCLTESMLAGAAFGVVAGLLVDPHQMDIFTLDIPRSEGAEAKIIAAVEKFWRDVEEGNEPEPDYGKDSAVIRALTAKEVQGKAIDLSGHNQIRDMLELRAALMRSIKLNDARCGEIEDELRLLIRDAEFVTGIPEWRITYKSQDRAEYTVKAKTLRVLRITDKRPAEAE